MKTPFPHRLTSLCAGLILSLALTAPSFAQDDTADTPSSDNTQQQQQSDECCQKLLAAVVQVDKDLVEGFKQFWKSLSEKFDEIFSSVFNFDDIASSVEVYNTSVENNWIVKQSESYTDDTVKTAMTMTAKSASDLSEKMADLVPGKPDDDYNLENFSITSLLGEKSLDETGVETAKTMLSFLSGINNPVFNLPENLANVTDTKSINDFRNNYGAYVAYQATGSSVFDSIIAERTQREGLGQFIGRPDDKVSLLEVREHLASLTLNDEWLKNLPNINPGDAARLQLILLARISQQLFENQMQLERLNATTAAQLLQQLNGISKPLIVQQRAAILQQQR